MMKAYFSFLLVFISLFIFTILSFSYVHSSIHSNFLPFIMNQNDFNGLDVKRAMKQSAIIGAVEGASIYLLSALITEEMNVDVLKDSIKAGVISNLAMLKSANPDYKIILWCGNPSYQELRSMAENKKPCISCKPIALCKDSVSVSLNASNTSISIIELYLGKVYPARVIFGAIVYSNKFKTSGVYYISPNENLLNEEIEVLKNEGSINS